MTSLALLAGYDPYELKLNERRCRWEPPEWLATRLRQIGMPTSSVAHPWPRGTRETKYNVRKITLTGVVKLRAGVCWQDDGLMEWGTEAECMYKYMRRPTDAYSYRVEEIYKLQEPIDIHYQEIDSNGGFAKLHGPRFSMIFTHSSAIPNGKGRKSPRSSATPVSAGTSGSSLAAKARC